MHCHNFCKDESNSCKILPIDFVKHEYVYFSLEKADKSSDDYDNWCNDAAETKKIMENQQREVETCSKPTSDPEERKKHIVTITVSQLLMCIVWMASRALCQLCIRA